MKLVVGLGNPGRKYKDTRHNVGYMVLAELARRYGSSSVRAKFHADVVEANIEGERALLLSPLTYMNLSGTSVVEAFGFYKLELEDILVICDDLNLPLGKLRIRAKGSSGGQKGLADIIDRLGSEQFARLRIGIGEPPSSWNAADFVLSKFNKQETTEIELAVQQATDAVARWARDGIDECMNRHN
ncbi:MAG: aminoacyl-tRNA hydrolase [Pirellulales bacterium]|nr:aminoacyl-tRNA hydrolase [Pirellulales bacterium]